MMAEKAAAAGVAAAANKMQTAAVHAAILRPISMKA